MTKSLKLKLKIYKKINILIKNTQKMYHSFHKNIKHDIDFWRIMWHWRLE